MFWCRFWFFVFVFISFFFSFQGFYYDLPKLFPCYWGELLTSKLFTCGTLEARDPLLGFPCRLLNLQMRKFYLFSFIHLSSYFLLSCLKDSFLSCILSTNKPIKGYSYRLQFLIPSTLVSGSFLGFPSLWLHRSSVPACCLLYPSNP